MRYEETVPVFFGIYKATTSWKYDGAVLPFDPTAYQGFDPYPELPLDMRGDLDKEGATAIARCKPTNSVADAAVFLGELMVEGLPSITGVRTWEDRWKSLKTVDKTAAAEHLNIEFGIRPLVSEMQSFVTAASHARKVLDQYERDAGRVVRRRYDFPTDERTVDQGKVLDATPYGPASSQFFVGNSGIGGEVHRVDRFTRRVWFSGAFTYWIPSGQDSLSKFMRNYAEADKLFGTGLSPDTIWNLTPWSWAIDWFSNAGDVVSTLSDMATDGLVMRYGYIMEHVKMSSTFTHHGTAYKGGHQVQPLVYSVETKKRVPANPFGFGISWEGLSPRQLAILAALGITRRR